MVALLSAQFVSTRIPSLFGVLSTLFEIKFIGKKDVAVYLNKFQQ